MPKQYSVFSLWEDVCSIHDLKRFSRHHRKSNTYILPSWRCRRRDKMSKQYSIFSLGEGVCSIHDLKRFNAPLEFSRFFPRRDPPHPLRTISIRKNDSRNQHSCRDCRCRISFKYFVNIHLTNKQKAVLKIELFISQNMHVLKSKQFKTELKLMKFK